MVGTVWLPRRRGGAQSPGPGTMTALFFHPEGFSTKGPKLMGRHAAGESFLRGYFAHARADDLWIEVELAEHGETFAAAARAAGRAGKVHVVDRTATGALAAP